MDFYEFDNENRPYEKTNDRKTDDEIEMIKDVVQYLKHFNQ